MKKLKKLSIGLLDELAKNQQKLCELEMKSIVGGGSGTPDDPYSESEAIMLMDLGSFGGGYVEDSRGTVSYWHKEIIITPYGDYGSPYGMWGYMYGSYDGYGQYGSYGYESYYNGWNTLEIALTGAGIGVGVEGFLFDVAGTVCKSDAAKRTITEAMEASINASKIAGKFAKGCGAVGLIFSLPDGINSFSAIINGTSDTTADWLNSASIIFGTAGMICTGGGITAPIGIVCSGISISLSVIALIVDE